MSVTLDDLPQFMAAAVSIILALAVLAAIGGVQRQFIVTGLLAVAVTIAPPFFGLGPPVWRSTVSYGFHAVKRTGVFTPEGSRKFDFDDVGHGILLGRQPRDIKDLEVLKERGVIAIVTLNEPWELFIPELGKSIETLGMKHLHIKTADFQAPAEASLIEAVQFLQLQLQNSGSKVFVHCNAGRGRSAVVAAAYLLCKDVENTVDSKSWDPSNQCQKIVREMRVRRPVVTANLLRYPLTGQSRALRAFATNHALRIANGWKKVS